MLDRFEGYTQPQPPQLKPPPGPNLLGLDNTLHQPMDQYEVGLVLVQHFNLIFK